MDDKRCRDCKFFGPKGGLNTCTKTGKVVYPSDECLHLTVPVKYSDPEKPKAYVAFEPYAVRCINNDNGFEKLFDIGVEYMVLSLTPIPEFICVEDSNGDIQTLSASRFSFFAKV